MESRLTAVFELIDNFSSKLDAIANGGDQVTERLESAGDAADSAFDGIESGAATAAAAIDGVAKAASSSTSSVDAAARALQAKEEADAMCEQSAKRLSAAMETTQSVQDELSAAIESADEKLQNYADSGDLSTDMMEQLEQASSEATAAMENLAKAQQEAQEAMDYYDKVIMSGTEDLEELQSASDRASSAAEALEAAQESASQAMEDLSETSAKAAEEAENGGKKGVEAIDAINSALAAAGITVAIKEITGAIMEASEAAAEFETAMMKISTIADTSVVSLSDIQSQITALSKETGQSATDLSEAVYSALSASVDTASAVEFTATATKLASGGFTSSATAVDVLTTALNAYGLEASEAENISDMLITTQNLGKTTVDELAQSVGKVIPLASAYGVEMDNLSAAYAELTKGGIATAEAGTYLKSMLNELGDSGSVVAETLTEQTGFSFASLMEQGYSLGDVMEVLGDAVGGDATAFNELWSSSEAGIGALSLFNAGADQFNTTLGAMQASAGATQTAFETMTDTTAHAKEEFSNAATNLQNSIGNVINPSLEELYNAGTNVLNLASSFIDEHPAVAKGFVAIGTGVGAVAVALGGLTAAAAVYKAGMAAATIVTDTFGISLKAALGPIGLVSAAIAGVAAVVMTVKENYDKTYDEAMSMTAVTRQQTEELEALNKEYENQCETYGELSSEASSVKVQIDDLTAALEANGMSVAESVSKTQSLVDNHNSIISNYEDTTQAIKDEEINSFALITKLEQLATATDTATGSQSAMKAIIDQLNGSIEGVDYDKLMNMDSGDRSNYLKGLAVEEAQRQQAEADMQEYIQLLQETDGLKAEVDRTSAETLAAAQAAGQAGEAYWNSHDSLGNFLTFGLQAELDGTKASYDAAEDVYEQMTDAQSKAKAAYQENIDRIAELENELGIATDSSDLFNDSMSDAEVAATAYNTVKAGIEDLCEKYDKAYDAALASFQGQFGLFDTAEANMEQTVNATQSALDSQLSYWENYNNNLSTLTAYSETLTGEEKEKFDNMLAQINDGSEQAAGLLSDMASQIEAGTTAPVEEMSNTYAQIAEQQQQAAATTAEWQTDFTAKMNEYAEQMNSIVSEDLELSEEAKTSAETTINSYVQAILAGTDDATAAAKQVAAAVAAALAETNISVNVSTSTNVEGNAVGTTNAADIFIAGEEGPELVVGKRGSTVFPHEETEKIIAAVSNTSDTDILTQYPQTTDQNFSRGVTVVDYTAGRDGASIFVPVGEEKARNDTSSGVYDAGTRKILLEIAGKGNIEIQGGASVDEDTLLNFLYQYLKPVLLQMIQQEIYEEGENSYDY